MSLARDIADLGAVTSRLDTVGASSGALSNRNLVINGAMQVAQRGTSSTGVGASSGYFVCDRWRVATSTSGRLTISQDSDSPQGFANSTKLACTTADTSIASSELFIFQQRIEGQNVQQFAKGTSGAKSITVSFYVKGNAAATYTAELEDSDNSRYNSQEFSVTTDWTRVTKTFVADTTGTLDDDNAVSFRLNIWLHAGSNYTSGTHTDNVWHTAQTQRVGDNATSIFDSTSRTLQITGLQMEVGDTATDFEHRTFGDELQRCYRYFQGRFRTGVYEEGASTARYFSWILPVPMRATPSATRLGNSISSREASGTVNMVPQNTTDGYIYHSTDYAVGGEYSLAAEL